jgi:hypothetical protein
MRDRRFLRCGFFLAVTALAATALLSAGVCNAQTASAGKPSSIAPSPGPMPPSSIGSPGSNLRISLQTDKVLYKNNDRVKIFGRVLNSGAGAAAGTIV